MTKTKMTPNDVLVVGFLDGVAYNSDAMIYDWLGISPTIRAEAHGHLPNVLIVEDDDRTDR